MKSFTYCFLGTLVSLLAMVYSVYAPWALIYLDMTESSFLVKVPVLLWQGCFTDHSCLISSLVDTKQFPTLTYDTDTLALFSTLLLTVYVLQALGIIIGITACIIHLLDMFKIKMMHSSYRFVYPAAVVCSILSLLVFFPTLIFFIQGGYFLSG